MSVVICCEDGLVLWFYIQLKVSCDSIVGLYGDEVKVVIIVLLVDGQVNSYLIKFFGKQFCVVKSQIVIEKGELGCYK